MNIIWPIQTFEYFLSLINNNTCVWEIPIIYLFIIVSIWNWTVFLINWATNISILKLQFMTFPTSKNIFAFIITYFQPNFETTHLFFDY
jgi:hypothetical protein